MRTRRCAKRRITRRACAANYVRELSDRRNEYLLAGISPDIFLLVGPFNIITSCLVHANLNWTFGPLRYVLVSPVFHRWHHTRAVRDKNFASTFAIWDVMFGTSYMPAGVRPSDYGIDDAEMPDGMWAQIAYPLLQRDEPQMEPRPAA